MLTTTTRPNSFQEAKARTYCYHGRLTFGIIDPLTKKKYEDIVSCHLEALTLQLEDFLYNENIEDAYGLVYRLQPDAKTISLLEKQGYANVLISFQVRKTEQIAVVRLFDPKRAAKPTDL